MLNLWENCSLPRKKRQFALNCPVLLVSLLKPYIIYVMAGKRNSIVALTLFELFFTCLLVIILTDIYRDMKTFRLNKLHSDSYLLGELIRDSHTASEYLLKSIITIIPPDQIYYPPRNTELYSDDRERLYLLRSAFPHARLTGLIDDSGVLTHSLYHDGMDMTRYDFYNQILRTPAGFNFFSDAFLLENGTRVVCHALRSSDPDRKIIALMMIELDYFEEWLDRLDTENHERIVVADRKGNVLAGECIGSCALKIEELGSLLSDEPSDEDRFRLHKSGKGELFTIYRIQGLPYSVIFSNPELISLRELLLPMIIIMIGYCCVVVLGVVVFRSHISQIELNRKLKKTSSEMTVIFENSMVGIIMLDDQYCISRANARFAEILGYDSPDEVLGIHISEFHTSFESFREFVGYYKKELQRGGIVKLEYEFRRKDGSSLWARVVGKPLVLKDETGSVRGDIWIAEDISDQRRAEEALKKLASTDPMTGIANRRRFMKYGKREYAIFLRHKRPLTAVMLDIDHFKAVNDTFGHAVGDRALILAVEICGKSLRAGDLFGRIGGEEFALILPDTNSAAAFLVAERIRGMIEGETKDREDGIPPFTVSMGIAEAGEGDFDSLLRRADEALYKAKEEGRNRVVTARL